MIYSEDHRFAFYPLPKTATCSLWELLALEYNAQEYPHDPVKGRHVMELPPGDYSNYLFFTVVRHPFARARSLWDHCQRLEGVTEDFEGFVWKYLVPRTTWLCATQSEWLKGLRVDRILRLEKLQEEFAALPFVHCTDIPFVNRSRQRNWVISMRTYEGVWEWAKEDFEQYDYHYIKL